MATAGAVLLAAAPACPASPGTATRAGAPASPLAASPVAAAPADRSLSELLTALKGLYRKAETASESYRRTARELRDQQRRTDKLERRLAQVRVGLNDARREAARIARAQYRTGGAPGLPPTVRVLLADDPVIAMHHSHALRRAATRQQATVRALSSGERHRGAVASEAREALQRQQKLTDRKKRNRQAARAALREVERMLTSLTPDQLAALRRYERAQAPGSGTAAVAPDPGSAGL
jgi:peptidoglycan DL-endopeptidase CwlO